MWKTNEQKIKMEEGTSKDFAEMRIVVVGKTGSGKSALAHTIFGEEQRPNNTLFNSETTRCEAKTRDVHGKRITLIDCPGFFDTNMSEKKLRPEILRCIIECAPGPHAFLIVLKTERFTVQEQSVITKICECFSDEALKHAVVVFTHGDQLPKGRKIAEFVHENKLLSDLVKKCGNRCHVVDNKYWRGGVDEYRSNQFQVNELLHTVETMMETNENSFFTTEMLKEVDEEIRKEEAKIRQEAGNKSVEEIKQEAKESVFKRYLISVTGTAVGMLLGALFGIGLVEISKTVALNASTLDPLLVGVSKLALDLAGSKTTMPVAAAVGGVVGGFTGHGASDGAETLQEAAGKAAEAVGDVAQCILKKAQNNFQTSN